MLENQLFLIAFWMECLRIITIFRVIFPGISSAVYNKLLLNLRLKGLEAFIQLKNLIVPAAASPFCLYDFEFKAYTYFDKSKNITDLHNNDGGHQSGRILSFAHKEQGKTGIRSIQKLKNIHKMIVQVLAFAFFRSWSLKTLIRLSMPTTGQGASFIFTNFIFSSTSPSSFGLSCKVSQQLHLSSGYSGSSKSMKQLCFLAWISCTLNESGYIMEILCPLGLKVYYLMRSTGYQYTFQPEPREAQRQAGFRERMLISPETHLEMPFMLAWSCQPKDLLAGIIRKASVNSLVALMIMAVISGRGGNYLKAYSIAVSFMFSSSRHRISWSADTTNCSGVIVCSRLDFCSTSSMKPLSVLSYFRCLCSLFKASIECINNYQNPFARQFNPLLKIETRNPQQQDITILDQVRCRSGQLANQWNF